MANNYMQFSFVLTLASEADAALFLQEHKIACIVADEIQYDEGIDFLTGQSMTSKTGVLICSDESGSVNDAVDFIEQFVSRTPQTGTVQIEWAEFCSKMRPGEVGGGAVLVDLTGKCPSKWGLTSDPLSFDAPVEQPT